MEIKMNNGGSYLTESTKDKIRERGLRYVFNFGLYGLTRNGLPVVDGLAGNAPVLAWLEVN